MWVTPRLMLAAGCCVEPRIGACIIRSLAARADLPARTTVHIPTTNEWVPDRMLMLLQPIGFQILSSERTTSILPKKSAFRGQSAGVAHAAIAISRACCCTTTNCARVSVLPHLQPKTCCLLDRWTFRACPQAASIARPFQEALFTLEPHSQLRTQLLQGEADIAQGPLPRRRVTTISQPQLACARAHTR